MWWRSRSTSLESGIANRFPGLVFLNYDTANRGPLGDFFLMMRRGVIARALASYCRPAQD